jgi:16S rRNA (guanine966-N2)-methyltransferase
MRVIAGTLRRRTLLAPAGMATRPTSDRLRETLFNVLAPRIEGARFLDLYAGSGAVVERAANALKVLRANLESLGLRGGVRVEAVSVAAFLKKVRPESSGFAFDIMFMDPPYDAVDEYGLALGLLGKEASRLLARDAVVIAEHRRKEKLEERYGVLEQMRVLEQGDAALSFYKAAVSSQLSADI